MQRGCGTDCLHAAGALARPAGRGNRPSSVLGSTLGLDPAALPANAAACAKRDVDLVADRHGRLLSSLHWTLLMAPIDVMAAAHDGSSLPACSRTMDSAYPLGQSASGWPVRFSCWPCAAPARRSAAASSDDEVNVV